MEQKQTTANSSEIHPHVPRSMQWFFLILVALWIFASMTLPVVAFLLTKNYWCFSLITSLAPPVYILYRITRYLFPKSEKDYELAAKKIAQVSVRAMGVKRKMRSQIHHNHVRFTK